MNETEDQINEAAIRQQAEAINDCPAAFEAKRIATIYGVMENEPYNGRPYFTINVFAKRDRLIVTTFSSFEEFDDERDAITYINALGADQNAQTYAAFADILNASPYFLREDDIDALTTIAVIRRLNKLEQDFTDRLEEIQAAFSHFTEVDKALESEIRKVAASGAPVNYNIFNKTEPTSKSVRDYVATNTEDTED